VNWVQFHAETGGWKVEIVRDDRSPSITGGKAVIRRHYRFQVQGPNAAQILDRLNGGPIPDVKFFHLDAINVKGRKVRALRHGMAGAPGLEVWGPYEQMEEVRAAIVEAGKDFGLVQVGARAYATNTLESGWIPSPLPAVYTGEKMKKYREWLPANGYEATGSLGGSYLSNNIEDYYVTPYEMGYGSFVKFDHDFVGREALEKIAAKPRRKKVTLVLNSDDVTRGIATMFQQGQRTKYFDFPSAVYSTLPYDKVVKDGKVVGVSTWCGYSANEGAMLTLAILDVEHSEPGTQVTFVWGEEGGGSSKPTVERHVQLEIRATVAPVPYADAARTAYRVG
jgi:vanillate/3-O-methylgallate O-demethylase